MKICYLAAADSVHSHRWIRFFADRGHDVHWISLTPFSEKPANVTCYDWSGDNKWKGFFRAATKVRGLVASIKPDILHAHYAGTYGVLGALSGFQPYVLTAWGSDVLIVGAERIRGLAVRWALRSAKLITCDAYHMIDAMRELGVAERKIELIYFGIDTDRFAPGAADDEIVGRWGARGRPVVISLRSLEPIYDIGTLLNAIPAVVKEIPEVLFVVCGSGSEADNLKRMATGLGIDRNVLFTGRYANAELPRMLRSADVYVSTSLSDAGIAASTAEAMACGIPVVVSSTGENDKWITEAQSGFLFPAKDSATLSARLVHMLKTKEVGKRVGAAGRQVIVDRNSYQREMEKMEQSYRTLAPSVKQ